MSAKQSHSLRDLPLWRLLVALADAERTLGTADPTTRTIARAVQERLDTATGETQEGVEAII